MKSTSGTQRVSVECKLRLCVYSKSGFENYLTLVDHSKIIEILSRTIKGGKVISLIHKYLNAEALDNGVFAKTEEGFLRGRYRFVRFADDLLIFCKSKKSANRVMNNIVPYIEEKLRLRVKQNKSGLYEQN